VMEHEPDVVVARVDDLQPGSEVSITNALRLLRNDTLTAVIGSPLGLARVQATSTCRLSAFTVVVTPVGALGAALSVSCDTVLVAGPHPWMFFAATLNV